jgi:CRISPR-associated protein Cas6
MNAQPIDLAFALVGSAPLPADHGYHLYSAISRALPAVHEPNGIAIHPIRGRIIGDRQMQLCDWSKLTIRISAERIAELLPLAGKQLNLAGRPVRVGVPQVHALTHATALRSRLVTIKVSGDRDDPRPPDETTFLTAARRQLDTLGISPEAQLTIPTREDPRTKEVRPLRRTLRIKDKEVVGYELLLEALSPDESLLLQSHGLGGRRHMGCGIFVPVEAQS